MKELVIISGKGGTGKTSITAGFASLAKDKVLADCDVDAADLHILVDPKIIHEEEFRAGVKARINTQTCSQCGTCRDHCRYDAIGENFTVNALSCEGCGVCFHICPEQAVTLEEGVNGKWFVSETKYGPMIHAALDPGEENSGKLVALVRNQAKVVANKERKSLVIIDGAPGVGCPVISSITGASAVLIVSEPSLSGLHDMKRAMQLVQGFKIPLFTVVNKFDLNLNLTEKIEDFSRSAGAECLGRIPYDETVIQSMVQRNCVVDVGESPAGNAIRQIWTSLEKRIV